MVLNGLKLKLMSQAFYSLLVEFSSLPTALNVVVVVIVVQKGSLLS